MTKQEKIAALEEIVVYIKELVLPKQEEISLNPKKMDDFIDEKVMWIDKHIKDFLKANPEDKFNSYTIFVLEKEDGLYYNNPFGLVKASMINHALEEAVVNSDLENAKKILNGVACLGNELENFKYLTYTKYSISPIRIIDLRYLALFIVFGINQVLNKLKSAK